MATSDQHRFSTTTADATATPGQLGYYPWGNDQAEPFVDPGNDPIAIKHELLRMLRDDSGVAMLKEAIDRDPVGAPVWLERCGLVDRPRLQQMAVLSKMYPACGPSDDPDLAPSRGAARAEACGRGANR
jgi:hypothetical protein